MTKSERAEYRRGMALNESAMLDRIEYHSRKLIEEGKASSASLEWIAFHRRRIAKLLGESQPA